MKQLKRVLGMIWIGLAIASGYFCIFQFGLPKILSGKSCTCMWIPRQIIKCWAPRPFLASTPSPSLSSTHFRDQAQRLS